MELSVGFASELGKELTRNGALGPGPGKNKGLDSFKLDESLVLSTGCVVENREVGAEFALGK